MKGPVGIGGCSTTDREVKTVARRTAISMILGALAVTAAAALLSGSGAGTAEANSCTAQCRAAHNQCRIATKGSPSCDAQLQACLSRCLRR